jgi:ABC-type antimicrobial peptide transport system permease subunit
MALGASAGDMQTMVLRQAGWLAAAGAAAGTALAVGVGLLLKGLLVGVPPLDLASYGVAALLFAAVLAAASWAPARRAATTAPAAALRAE